MPLDTYIEQLNRDMEKYENISETEKIMYIYLDLAKRVKFDSDFFFGGNKRKKELYNNSHILNELNRCFEEKKIICRSLSYILEYILKKFDISILTITEDNPLKTYNHVYNIIIPSDGSCRYLIDLQNDLANIHYHGFTSNFGISLLDDQKYIISKEEQKQMHLKFGYISANNLYVDNYIDLFKMYTESDLPFGEKIDLVLKNIEPNPYYDVDYWERRWKHEKMLSELFSQDELRRKLNVVEFYTIDENNIKKYNNGFFILDKGAPIVYYYSLENYQYESYSIKEFAQKTIAENIYHNQGIMGLNHEIKMLKDISEKKLVIK